MNTIRESEYHRHMDEGGREGVQKREPSIAINPLLRTLFSSLKVVLFSFSFHFWSICCVVCACVYVESSLSECASLKHYKKKRASVCQRNITNKQQTSKRYVMDFGAKICIIRTHGIVISE